MPPRSRWASAVRSGGIAGRESQARPSHIDGFNRSDHEQILSCLTDDIRWTVFGAFRLEGKEAYDAEIENPAFTGSLSITITRMVEEDDVVMAEMTLEAQRATGETMRAARARSSSFAGARSRSGAPTWSSSWRTTTSDGNATVRPLA